MKKDLWRLRIITFLAFCLFILPPLGLPRSVKTAIYSSSGFLIATLAFFTAKSFTREYVHHEDVQQLP